MFIEDASRTHAVLASAAKILHSFVLVAVAGHEQGVVEGVGLGLRVLRNFVL
jgi:hypothetical protein